MRPWLYGIAFRVASHHRRGVRGDAETLDDEKNVDPTPGADALLIDAEERSTLLRLLDGIDATRRIVFVMSELEEMPMNDIASALEIPVNTAYSRLRLARSDLRAAIKRLQAKGEP